MKNTNMLPCGHRTDSDRVGVKCRECGVEATWCNSCGEYLPRTELCRHQAEFRRLFRGGYIGTR